MATPLTQSTLSSNANLPADLLEKDLEDTTPSVPGTPADIEKASANKPAPDALPPRPYGGLQWFLVCVAIFSSAFLYGLDNTIVADVQAAVIETFGNVDKLGWLGIGFPLGSIATILSIGKAYGIFNMKWLYIASLVMFEAGSALCGGAPNMDALIVGRVWAGAGGAGMYLGVLNLLTVNTSIHERPMYMALTGLVWGSGCILGPVIGGGFSDSSATWRWSFYINLLIFALFSPVYLFVLKPFQPQPNIRLGEKIKHIDWIGVVLNAALYVAFVMTFTFGGIIYAWNDGRTIALFVVFGVILILFALQQGTAFLTTKERRLFPVDFLKRRTMILLYIATSAGATGLFVPIYYIPLYFSFVHNDSGMMAAVRLLPFICILIFATMVNGALMPKFGFYQPWYIVSGIFLVVSGSLMYSLVDVSTPNSTIYGFSVLMAIGAGVSQQAAYSIAPAKVGPNRASDAVGFINVAQIGAIVIALTINGSIFQNIGFQHISQALAGLDFSSEEIRAALAGAKSTVFTNVTPEVRQAVIEGIVKAIGDGWILVIVAGAVTLVAGVFMRWERLFMEASAGA